MKISVVFWSQSGNTAAMADAVGQGITEAGKEAEVIEVSSASLDALKEEKAFALGCPAMGDEVLEESSFEPMFEEVEEEFKKMADAYKMEVEKIKELLGDRE